MADPKPDSYEAQYMGGGEALFRERRGMPKWMHALFLVPLLLQLGVGISLLASGIATGLVNLVFVPLLALVWVLFLYLRVTVAKDALHIQYGLFGPSIPLERIQSVEVGKYDWIRFGGYGIRRRLGGGVAYSTPGGSGEALTVTYLDAKGKPAVVTVTTDHATELASLLRAKGRARIATPGPRVEADPPAAAVRRTEDDLFAEAEAEAEAILAREEAEKKKA